MLIITVCMHIFCESSSVNLLVMHDGLQVVRLAERIDFVRGLFREVLDPSTQHVPSLNIDVLITIWSDHITYYEVEREHRSSPILKSPPTK